MNYKYNSIETVESASEISISLLKVHFERYTVEITIRRPLSLLWTYVIKKVLSLHLRQEEEYVHYNVISRECGMHKLIDEIGLSLPRITSNTVWLIRKYSIYDLADSDVSRIFSFLRSPQMLALVAAACKRTLRLITTDEIYLPVFYNMPLLWQGRGNGGTEAAVWEKYKENMSLEYYTICRHFSTLPISCPLMHVRLRWNCHHTSRLRLLYGERLPADDVFSGCTLYLGAPPEVNKV